MIRAVVFTAIGFWISSQVYERLALKQRKVEKEATKRKLRNYLISVDWNQSEIEGLTLKVFGTDE